MSANEDSSVTDDRSRHISQQYHSGMTPSIISTINNANPTPPFSNNNSNSNPNSKLRKQAEPFYESYIEDSFVGHWEREDDDIHHDRKTDKRGNDANSTEEEDSALHPSTIELDFDSFGPESFIYTSQKKSVAVNDHTTEGEGSEANLTELVQSKQDEGSDHASNSDPHRKSALTPSPLNQPAEIAHIDLKVIEPYKRVISHAGYCHHFDPSAPPPKPGEPAPAIIVFSACYLPDRSRRDYNYVMDHLFLYVLSSLHELIADDYILIYLHNANPSSLSYSISSRLSSSMSSSNGSSMANGEDLHQNNLPTFTWMKRCYQMIDRKLRKNLKILYLVKPTFWLKTIVIMCRPFISAKFSKKLRFVENMDDLKKCLPVDELKLPASASGNL